MTIDLKSTLAKNLKFIMEKRGLSEGGLSRMTDNQVSQKTINNLKNQRQSATLDTRQHLSEALRIDVALLLQPGFRDEMASNSSVSKLFQNYIDASAEGQLTIYRVAEREAEYALTQSSGEKQ